MKILLVNNFYYNRGGDCTYLFALKGLLEKKGHSVIVFSMNHPQNFKDKYSRYFVSYINYDEEVKHINLSSGFQVLKRTIFSREARDKLDILIRNEKPDLAHLQNIHHHITPSIFNSIKKHNIPIVWTLHDYTLICPNTSFLSHGNICERCKKRKYFWPLLVKCKKNSFSASTMAAIETTLHRIMHVNDLVDIFITPSNFLREKLIEYGFNKNKICRLNNFSNIEPAQEVEKTGDYYLYVGRLSQEKGIMTLIDAALQGNSGKLKIVGGGPLTEKTLSYIKMRDKGNRIDYLGHKNHDDVINLIKNSRFVVVPSEWYENYPFAILEAFACGKPVVGSNIGGIPELVRDTERGLIFKTGDADDLSAAIRYLLKNPDIAEEMGSNAREFIDRELNSERHYEELMKIYMKLS